MKEIWTPFIIAMVLATLLISSHTDSDEPPKGVDFAVEYIEDKKKYIGPRNQVIFSVFGAEEYRCENEEIFNKILVKDINRFYKKGKRHIILDKYPLIIKVR